MKYLLIALSLGCMASLLRADDKPALPEKKDKISYSMGFNIGNAWKRQAMEPTDVDLDLLVKGIRDAFAGSTPAITDQENNETMRAFQTELRTRMQEKRKQLAEKNKKEGAEFLAANKTKPGVQTLPDGLQYKVVTEGNGPKPNTNDTVLVNYRGTLVDGTEFDASKPGQPVPMRVNGVIKGWSEALQMMPIGSKWQLFIPSDLAYKEMGRGQKIGPDATLIFDVEVVSIKPEQTATNTAPKAIQQPVTSDIIKVPSAEELKKGAKIEIIKPDQVEKEKEKQQEQKK